MFTKEFMVEVSVGFRSQAKIFMQREFTAKCFIVLSPFCWARSTVVLTGASAQSPTPTPSLTPKDAPR